MKRSILTFIMSAVLALSSCTGCKKEYKYPEPTLIGTWLSQDPVLQYPIDNLDGKGKVVQFLQYEKDSAKYLKVTHPNGVDNYLIHWIGKRELVLIDSNQKHINFVRID